MMRNERLNESLKHSGQACEPSPLPELRHLPLFRTHAFVRGGHLQTILSLRKPEAGPLNPTLRWVDLEDGDQLAMHDDCPPLWRPGDPAVMLVHGLCGSRLSPYMVRLANRFLGVGTRVFRLEMRGCGAGRDRSRGLTHAGRSDDCVAALSRIAGLTEAGPIAAIGISLGGNQLLRAAGLIGSGVNPRPAWMSRWDRLVAVSPPVDLARCSQNMQRFLLRGYNLYFIHFLLRRLPEPLRGSQEAMARFNRPWPRTLWELDERITAPLSGFRDAADYYAQASSGPWVPAIDIPTLILTSADDPLVPIGSFDPVAEAIRDHSSVRLLVSRGGGHVGFLARGTPRFYMDEVVDRWCSRRSPVPSG